MSLAQPSAQPGANQDHMRRLEAVRPRLVSFALLQLRDRNLAEDAVQEALAAAIEKDASFQERSGYETWVFGILKYKILDSLRQQRRQGKWRPFDEEIDSDALLEGQFQQNGRWQVQARPAAWGDPEAAFTSERFWQMFDTCMVALPDNVARIFSMRELMGLSTLEICQETGIKENNCWVILHRARLRLRACIEHGWLKETD
ncbi:sigma-70 family RNA polymerase sigma factor [Pistricoccus aurantiacus]|nr:sigma-70 family RNA polymerase sigma factor [Pistricoccus aurantiacus]